MNEEEKTNKTLKKKREGKIIRRKPKLYVFGIIIYIL